MNVVSSYFIIVLRFCFTDGWDVTQRRRLYNVVDSWVNSLQFPAVRSREAPTSIYWCSRRSSIRAFASVFSHLWALFCSVECELAQISLAPGRRVSWSDQWAVMASVASRVVCCLVMAVVWFAGMSAAQNATEPDLSDLDFIPEQTQRAEFPASDFIFPFTEAETVTPFGNLRNLFINQDPILATLPHGGVAQNLVTLGPCAINQPHSHPRGTEISHVTEGTSPPSRFPAHFGSLCIQLLIKLYWGGHELTKLQIC